MSNIFEEEIVPVELTLTYVGDLTRWTLGIAAGDTAMTEQTDEELVRRLRRACVGQPAKIAWPHRVLHEAADRLEALAAELAEARAEVERLQHMAADAYAIGVYAQQDSKEKLDPRKTWPMTEIFKRAALKGDDT